MSEEQRCQKQNKKKIRKGIENKVKQKKEQVNNHSPGALLFLIEDIAEFLEEANEFLQRTEID